MRKLAAAVAVAALVLVAGGAAADTFAVRLVSQTTSTITLGWDAQPGYGYLFSADGKLVSRTNDPGRTTVKFSKQYKAFDIDVIVKGSNGHYPTVVIPPPPTASIRQTISADSTIPSLVTWRAVYDSNGDGTEDDPGHMQFRVDGNLVLSEEQIPFGDTFTTGTISVADGQHTFEVTAVADDGTVLATNTVTATVKAVVQPPPPPPPPPNGYPDASNTGVPAGTVLTPSGGLTINTPNTVVNQISTSGTITVNTTGVVIKNSRTGSISVENGSATIQDTTINCGGSGTKGIVGNNYTALRVNISNCEDGIYIYEGNVVLRDSYIHDLAGSATAHNDGIQAVDGSNTTIEHNRIYAIDTSAININNNFSGPHTHDTLIQNNLLAGGAWTLYCPRPSTTNFRVVGNAFSTIFFPKVGVFGPYTDCDGETFTGNFILETGSPA